MYLFDSRIGLIARLARDLYGKETLRHQLVRPFDQGKHNERRPSKVQAFHNVRRPYEEEQLDSRSERSV